MPCTTVFCLFVGSGLDITGSPNDQEYALLCWVIRNEFRYAVWFVPTDWRNNHQGKFDKFGALFIIYLQTVASQISALIG
jgi:hypothetical protein